ncbi:MAG: hypothetical protein ACYC6B_00050 [Thermoleophilia bacterium]
MVYWTVCPECLTYICVEETAIKDEKTASCPYCEIPISLLGGTELVASCRDVQILIEDIEQKIRMIPAAIDVHRFLAEQIDYIAAAFNDRLDDIQSIKDSAPVESTAVEAKQAR